MKLILSLTLSTILFACGGSGPDGAIGLQATDNAGSDPVIFDSSQTAFTLESASLHVTSIELRVAPGAFCVGCNNDTEIVLDGPWDIDLLTGEFSPMIEGTLPQDIPYERIRFIAEEDQTNTTFKATTGFDYDSTQTKLVVDVGFTAEIDIEPATPLVLEGDAQLSAALISDGWLDGMQVSACIDNGDLTVSNGTVVLSNDTAAGACGNAVDIIRDNLTTSGQLLGN